jgi:hypothetical protein
VTPAGTEVRPFCIAARRKCLRASDLRVAEVRRFSRQFRWASLTGTTGRPSPGRLSWCVSSPFDVFDDFGERRSGDHGQLEPGRADSVSRSN